MPTGITSLTNIGNGLAANDGAGDALRTGADKINSNNAAIVAAVNNLAASQAAGRISYLTKADMDADLAHADGTLADVTNDATTDNNRSYRKSGASGAGAWAVTIDRVDTAVAVVTTALDEAVDSAEASAGTATAAATNAATAQTDAETAQAFAEAAQAAALAAQSATETARDTSSGIYATTAKALSNGVKSLASLVAGSGGTDGTFALAFSGGGGSGAAGTFTVAGGSVVSTQITYGGDSYTSAPTVSFSASSGLTGASATAVISANVPSGKYFSIPSASSNGYLDLYLNNAGSAVLQKTYPSSVMVSAIDARVATVEPIAAAVLPGDYIDGDLIAFADALGKVVGRIKADAGWDILLSAIKSTTGLEVYEYDSLDGGGDGAVFTDAAGKVLARFGDAGDSTEVVAARGSRTDLNTRISQAINPYGSPIHHFWGEWYLRETRQRLRKRLLGESAQFVVASIGDSWTHNASRWCGPTAASLKTGFGDAGAGYVSFAMNGTTLPNGNVLSNSAVTYTGTWDVSAYYTAYSPDLGQATSSTATDRLSYTIAASPSAVKLYAQGGAGVVRYRFNAGAWTSIDLSVMSAGLQVVDLPSPAAGVFDVEVVSGAPVLFGIDVQKSTDGVRWHKLGATGSRANHFAAVDATQWKAGMTALAPHLVTILLATNDQGSYDAEAFRGYVQTMIDRVKSALPLADLLLIIPCENGLGRARPMTQYAQVMYELAAVNQCAFLDLQYVFGNSFSEYASTSPRAWFNVDNTHPEPTTGGRVIVDAVLRLLTQN